ncbi:cation-dependent mannose-6-phosphate receptor-like [Littorina saxatilis]|uniref:Autophagy-related protein 27 n=1 Tax=Littorina saxatilis TaxID=31220 RepID=A0AAN9BN96_9CAEN
MLQNSSCILGRIVCLIVFGLLTPWEGSGRGSLAQQCLGVDGCGCVFDDNSGVIDVSSLGNTDNTPRFKDVQADDFYYYSFNPCKPFSEITCSGASVCQVDASKTASYQAGDSNAATWSYDGTNVLVTYVSTADPSTTRSGIVTYICDESANEATMTAQGETSSTIYGVTVTTKCACKNGCSGGSIHVTVEVSILSTGSIMLIIFFVVLIIYVAAGIAYNRTRKQATGMEMVPNISFWRAIPGYVKDGFVFTTGKIRPKKSGYDEV